MQRRIEIGAWLLVVPVALIPLCSSSSLSDPALLSRQLLYLAFAVLAWMLLWFGSNRKALPQPAMNLLPFAWAVAYCISGWQALNGAEALYTISKISLYAAALWLCMQLIQSGIWQLKHILTGVILAALLSFALFCSEAYSLYKAGSSFWKGNELYQFYTAFGHKNLYSSFILLCMPFLLLGLVHIKNAGRWLLAIFVVLLLASLVLLRTRAVWLGMGIAAGIFVFLYFTRISPYTATYRKGIARAMLILLGTLVLMLVLKPSWAAFILNNDTARERILLWNNTLQMIQEHGLWGVGAGNWQVWFPKYSLEGFLSTNYHVADGFTTFQRPHNDLLWAWSEAGVAGFAAYTLLLLYPVYILIKKLGSTNTENVLSNSILLCTYVAYLVVMLTDFPLERNEHQWLFALLYALSVTKQQATKEPETNARLYFILTGIMLLFSLWFAIQRYPAEVHSKRVIEAHGKGNMEKIRSEAAQINMDVLSLNSYSMPISWYEGLALYALGQEQDALFKFKEAAAFNPYQVHVLMNVAGMYEFKEDHEAALLWYNRVLEISPRQPDAILNKSAVLFNQGKTALAMRCLYQLKYDTLNTQFLGYLGSIGKAYATENPDSAAGMPAVARLNEAQQLEYFKNKFKTAQEKKLTFEEIVFE